jgi:hypothetical protein
VAIEELWGVGGAAGTHDGRWCDEAAPRLWVADRQGWRGQRPSRTRRRTDEHKVVDDDRGVVEEDENRRGRALPLSHILLVFNVYTSAFNQFILHQYLSNIICQTISHNNFFRNDLSHSYDIHLKFHHHHYVLRDRDKKIRSHLHIFF